MILLDYHNREVVTGELVPIAQLLDNPEVAVVLKISLA